MALKFSFTAVADDWVKMIREKQRPVATAAVAALRDVTAQAVQEGRRDIAAAGPGFGKAGWQSGLRYKMVGGEEDGAPSLNAKTIIYHSFGIAGVFEYGATMHGRPLMWIPTTPGAPAPKKSRKKLAFATVNGTPLAFDAADKSRDRKPLYVGVPEVTIPKKFHITEIAEKNAKKIALAFIQHFKDE